jgi:hypothetical protein
MTKIELIQYLEPFTKDTRIILNYNGLQVPMKLNYIIQDNGKGVIVIGIKND